MRSIYFVTAVIVLCLTSSVCWAQRDLDCRLAAHWVSDSNDEIDLSGQRKMFTGSFQYSGGSFSRKKGSYSVGGGYRFDDSKICFKGTDTNGKNQEWCDPILLDDPDDPQSITIGQVKFSKVGHRDCEHWLTPWTR